MNDNEFDNEYDNRVVNRFTFQFIPWGFVLDHLQSLTQSDQPSSNSPPSPSPSPFDFDFDFVPDLFYVIPSPSPLQPTPTLVLPHWNTPIESHPHIRADHVGMDCFHTITRQDKAQYDYHHLSAVSSEVQARSDEGKSIGWMAG